MTGENNNQSNNGEEFSAIKPRGFSSKKNIIIIVLAGLLVLGGGITTIALSNSHSVVGSVVNTLKLAERYLSEQNYEQAVIEFQRVLEIEPMNVDAYLGLADAYVGLGDTEKALEILHEGFKRTEDERLRKCINEITIPSSSNDIEGDSSSSQTVSESAVDSIGSVAILGEKYDIATTTHLFLVDVGITDDILKQIVPEIEQLINLTDLFLLGNQISDITPLAELTCLQGLELGNNQISDITPLTGLTNLQDLDLTGNQIAETDKQWIRTQLPNCDIYG